jgi:glycosyltransferase involved in cell wall biosynthesis
MADSPRPAQVRGAAESRSASASNVAVVIPAYNHGNTIGDVVRRTAAFGFPVIVVNDGSTDNTTAVLASLTGVTGVTVLTHRCNRGKGAALMSGMAQAAPMADWAVTLDADGQHRPADMQRLLNCIPLGLRPIVVGCRRGMQAAPWTSRFGRGFSNFWVRMAGGPRVSDTQSGFRVYPLPETLSIDVKARRYQYEIEVLVKAVWQGIPVLEAPVGVTYGGGFTRISHFHPFFDFLRNTGVFSRLITHRVTRGLPG